MKTNFTPFLFACLLFCARPVAGQVLVYSSYPGAQAVVYLDFDGHTVFNTAWNWNGPIYCGPSGISEAGITEIYNRIAEDYRPFAINVTTDSSKFLAAPLTKRIRIIFTASYEWYGTAGGVSMVGSFAWGDDTPAFVFSTLLGLDNRKIAEAGSHEAGHSLGLYHQVVYDANCVQVAEYNPGTGSGEIAWAPIMGVGYYRNMTLWHNGPNYTGCSSTQDELQTITMMNNIPFRPDDHSAEFNRATSLRISANQFSSEGIIEKNDDSDLFKISLRDDLRLSLAVIPFNLGQSNSGSNMDMEVKLYDRNRSLIRTYNPELFLDCVVDTFLSRGSYYISVEGAGNQYSPDYASLGAYTIQGNVTSASRENSTAKYNLSLPLSVPLSRPQLAGNVIQNELQVKSPGSFNYYISDMQGVVYAKGVLRSGLNQLRSLQLAPGLYIISYDNGTERYSDKFLRQ
jgi:hypothetical protein